MTVLTQFDKFVMYDDTAHKTFKVTILDKKAFKTDESFLEKISIGSTGAKHVFEDLAANGHSPVELERGSLSFKIWKKIKIKRIRMPDLMCIQCGTRIESRAKTKLEITMSHSTSSPLRGWDSGLDENDMIAFVGCRKNGDRPIDWAAQKPIQYITTKDMRVAFQENKVLMVNPKGATEGFETRVTWPSAIASQQGTIIRLDDEKLQYKSETSGRTITLKLTRNGIKLKPLIAEGDRIELGQIVASVVPVINEFPCHGNKSEKYYLKLLHSPSLTDRYAAAKALTYFENPGLSEQLFKVMSNTKEHIYIRLEAASGLLRMGEDHAFSFFKALLADPYLEHRLECVIALGEINKKESRTLLTETLLDEKQNSEIRAGAAWSLGELKSKESLGALVQVFGSVDMSIKAEAARALAKINETFSHEIIKRLPLSKDSERAGLAWSLSKSGNFNIEDLMNVMVDDNARRWISWIIGTQDEKTFIHQIEELKKKDQEVYFAVTVFWKVLSSWIQGLDIY